MGRARNIAGILGADGVFGSSDVTGALGFTPVPQSNSSIRSTGVNQVTFGTSWANVNTTFYKWDIPSAGTYFLFATLRAIVWGTNGFVKTRLYNNTAGSAITDSDTMLLESGNNANTLNVCCTQCWRITTTGAATIYLQGQASVSGNMGVQSDVNGTNECGFLRVA